MKIHANLHKSLLFRILPLYMVLCSSFSACSQQHEKAAGSVPEKEHHHEVFHTNDTNEDAEVAQLRIEVLTLHDEAMSYMGDIMELRFKAKTRLHSLSNSHASTRATDTSEVAWQEEIKHLNLEIKQLDEAHNLMTAWMRNYDSTMEKKSLKEKLTYLEKEKRSIAVIKKQMQRAVEQCNISLKIYENQ